MKAGKGLGKQSRYQNGLRDASSAKETWKLIINKKLLEAIHKDPFEDCSEFMKELNYIPIKYS